MHRNDLYSVDVLGFNATERTMLSSIFALSARRSPGFTQHDPGSSGRPDLYLVDAQDSAAYGEFRVLSRSESLPAVMVDSAHYPRDAAALERPLQWARLLQALQDAVGDGERTISAALGTQAAVQGRQPAPQRVGSLPGLAGAPQGRGELAGAGVRRAPGDTVLVVDDNATVRMFMQTKLAPFGFEVDFAENGEQAVGLTASREYACIFLDVVMSGIDGYQVCKLIRANRQAIRKTAVVMLTSRSSPFDKLRGSLAGCDEYLTKPLDEDRLLEVIAKFLPSGRERARRARDR